MVDDCIKQEKMIQPKRKWLATASPKRKWSNSRDNGWRPHQARENDPTQPGLPPRTDQYPTLGPSLNLSRHPFEINIQAGIELTYVLKYFDDEKKTDFLQRVPSEAHLKYDFNHVHCSPLVPDQRLPAKSLYTSVACGRVTFLQFDCFVI